MEGPVVIAKVEKGMETILMYEFFCLISMYELFVEFC